ncbi:MAG: hypothetical protein ACFFCD_06255 [Promethearchaeota archaeon]
MVLVIGCALEEEVPIRIKISSILITLLLCVSFLSLCAPVQADENANNSVFVAGLMGNSRITGNYYVYVNDTQPSFTVSVDTRFWKGSAASNVRIKVEKPSGGLYTQEEISYGKTGPTTIPVSAKQVGEWKITIESVKAPPGDLLVGYALNIPDLDGKVWSEALWVSNEDSDSFEYWLEIHRFVEGKSFTLNVFNADNQGRVDLIYPTGQLAKRVQVQSTEDEWSTTQEVLQRQSGFWKLRFDATWEVAKITAIDSYEDTLRLFLATESGNPPRPGPVLFNYVQDLRLVQAEPTKIALDVYNGISSSFNVLIRTSGVGFESTIDEVFIVPGINVVFIDVLFLPSSPYEWGNRILKIDLIVQNVYMDSVLVPVGVQINTANIMIGYVSPTIVVLALMSQLIVYKKKMDESGKKLRTTRCVLGFLMAVFGITNAFGFAIADVIVHSSLTFGGYVTLVISVATTLLGYLWLHRGLTDHWV